MSIPMLPTASVLDTAMFLGAVLLPTLAKGPIIRRPGVVGFAERFRLDDRAVRVVRRLSDKHPEGPLLLRLPRRHQAVILAPGHVDTVLDMSPEPFSPATDEKRAALAHFQPNNVLISKGPVRNIRRALQEQVLESTPSTSLPGLSSRWSGRRWTSSSPRRRSVGSWPGRTSFPPGTAWCAAWSSAIPHGMTRN
ncbi:hypothetical protein IWX75_002079 [Arthrobacter sp. CAN_A6]|uniref:hypothetical protein n=1 Tax=Arthrobacter sp. CAN_A6 TaxID=2787721 RepID=UPI001A2D5991